MPRAMFVTRGAMPRAMGFVTIGVLWVAVPGILRVLRVERRVKDMLRFLGAHEFYVRTMWLPHTMIRRFILRWWLRSMLRSTCVYVNQQRVLKQGELPEKKKGLRCVVISDTHTMQSDLRLPPGDILIHAGDLLRRDQKRRDGLAELRRIGKWFQRQDFREKLVVAGNHDATLETMPRALIEETLQCRYCDDDMIEIQGFRFFLSPFSASNSAHSVNRAFQSPKRREKFRQNAKALKIDVLVTHGPPRGILDAGIGSTDIRDVSDALKPKFHVFGHQHNFVGVCRRRSIYINAANADGLFALTRPPFVFDLSSSSSSSSSSSDDDASGPPPSEIARLHVNYLTARVRLIS